MLPCINSAVFVETVPAAPRPPLQEPPITTESRQDPNPTVLARQMQGAIDSRRRLLVADTADNVGLARTPVQLDGTTCGP